MKMAGLCWISVLLAVSLSIENRKPLDIVYVKRIAELIQNKYPFNGAQFSVALNIPEDQKKLSEAFDNFNVVNYVKKGAVYKGSKAVVAVPQWGNSYTEHAEARVLDNLGNLAENQQDNILVLYSWYSPCGKKCTKIGKPHNILDKIKGSVKGTWKSYAFVFNTVYPKEDDIKGTLRNLRRVIVDDNIFRCYKPINRVFQCFKCFVDASKTANPVDECVQN